MRHVRLLGYGTVIVLLLLLGLCFRFPKPAQSAEAIKIGALLDFAGSMATFGPIYKDMLNFRFEEAGWKVGDRPIELVIEDCSSVAATTLDKAKKMVESDRVNMLIGPLLSDVAMGVASYAAQKKIVNLSVGSHPYEIKQFGWTIVPAGTLTQCTYPAGLYGYEGMGLRKVTSVVSDYAAGKLYLEGFEKAFSSKGGKVIQKQWVPLGTSDYGPYLAALKDADAVVVWVLPAPAFVSQYNDFGVFKRMPILNIQAGSIFESHLQELGKTVGDNLLRLTGAVPYAWRYDNPANNEFVKKFEKKFGGKPNSYHQIGYLSADVAIKALQATKGDTTPETLRQAVLSLKIDTIVGPQSFTPSGFGLRNIFMADVKKIDKTYSWIPVKPYLSKPLEE